MDLISREAVLKRQFTVYIENMWHMTEGVKVVETADIEKLPSAFEGMTNGEVMKAVFESDNVQFNETGSWIHIVINGMDYSFCPVEFWDSPYQKGGEA